MEAAHLVLYPPLAVAPAQMAELAAASAATDATATLGGEEPLPPPAAVASAAQPEEEELLIAVDGVELQVAGEAVGHGALSITSRSVQWAAAKGGASRVFSYPRVLLHAVCRDKNSVPRPCIFLQIEEEDDSTCTEVHLVPDDPEVLDRMFAALCQGAELNPDESSAADSGGGGEDDGGMVWMNGSDEEKLDAFDRLLLTNPTPGQFDDAPGDAPACSPTCIARTAKDP